MSAFPRSEAFGAGMLLAGTVGLPAMAILSAYYPLLNKGCDTDLPDWSWNGCFAGLVAGPVGGASYWLTRYETAAQRSLFSLAKSLTLGTALGITLGGFALQDYWRLVVVEGPFGSKCAPPHRPRKFPPVRAMEEHL